MLVHFDSSLMFNLCLFPYVKVTTTTNFWKLSTSNPPMQNGNTLGSACHFPTEDRSCRKK